MSQTSILYRNRKTDFQKFLVAFVCALLLSSSVFAAATGVGWTARYNGEANSSDYALDIALDSAGNVYVTGRAKNTVTGYDFVTIKYTPDGNTAWTKEYNSPSSDFASAIAVDANSDIIVAGYSDMTTGYDGIIIKYTSSGSPLWTAAYNYSDANSDRYYYFYDVATDANGNIYAVGERFDDISDDCLIVKYTPDGNLAWATTYDGSANGLDALYKVAIDSNGNVYACGESAVDGNGQDCLTLKYLPDGTLSWAKTYDGSAGSRDDQLEAIALDSAGNIYVTGFVETATGSDSNYVTIKYSPDGNSLWPTPAFYRGTAPDSNKWNDARAIAVSSDGNIVVTGYSQGTTNVDAATVKYDSATGARLWAARYNGAANSTDYAEAIAADNFGNVYVHGRSTETNPVEDYLTIRYGSNGTELWKISYDGPALLTDIGTAIAVNNNAVYVTGYSTGSGSGYDYATISLSHNATNNLLTNPGIRIRHCRMGSLWLLQRYGTNNRASKRQLQRKGLRQNHNLAGNQPVIIGKNASG